ncbi:dethiobiotin synthase [Candidatus Sumerlaeota bacterium]|nr:dethiobiotin synthase [Candidatus Sumerlaeota bacterium]MBI3737157.1 dethiobiotin synthase [Candidatus Sumerlaeota bacterium]
MKSKGTKRDVVGDRFAGSLLGVIGTDTEVGKTIITAALAREYSKMKLRVGVFKPFACDPARRPDGRGYSTDADLLARAAGMEGGDRAACGQLFSAPLSPLAAAEKEGRKVNLRAAIARARKIATAHDLTLVEGCGGWEVPLTWKETTADYFESLGAPVILVARAGLGTINHCLLTLEAVRRRKLKVLCIILNRSSRGPADESAKSNPRHLHKITGLPILGPVEFSSALDGIPGDQVALDDLPNLASSANLILRLIGRSRPNKKVRI